ncbi:thermonuclease family protein [Robertmurraya korlensis]|uniref:thermonuclease family protein n=1 Tax=Robertmurraya korlensis TaxID=519977 RepID=UPI0008258F43|nr:thermonuclease family protein [Robertmurraya korlensis]
MVRLLTLYLVLFLFLSGCSPTKSVHQQNVTESTEFKRVQVALDHPVDGDTISVIYQGEEHNVRFLLVDTPETSHPRLGEQPFGQEAKDFTSDLVTNAKTIELEFDIGPQKDKYGRLLAYVYVDGTMVQEELLQNSLARVAYVYPPNTRYVDPFTDLQKEAQQQGIGIWEVENYVQEDGFKPEVIESPQMESGTELPESCLIKGNIGSKKIYHTPDSPWYEQTKAEVMFCTEQEAIDAGFRAPKGI